MTLDKEDRQNVVYITLDGEIYSNRENLKDGMEVQDISATEVEEDDDRLIMDDDREIMGDGPFYRRTSRNGYSRETARVYLPTNASYKNELKCKGDTEKANDWGETPFIYLGGTCTTKNTGVDAGLQYSNQYDDWAVSTLVTWYDTTKKGYKSVPKANWLRFKSGQEVFMKFYVNAPNKVTISVTGITTNNKKEPVTIVRDAPGWNTAGTGCNVKRLTTIAQYKRNSMGEKYLYENFSTGSYLRNVKWSGCQIGNKAGSERAWTNNDYAETKPNPANKVTVANRTATSETVSINLK